MNQQDNIVFFYIHPQFLLLLDTSTRILFVLSKNFLERLNVSTYQVLTKNNTGNLTGDMCAEVRVLLESHPEEPTDYIRIPLTRIAEDTVLREMRKSRGGRFIDGYLGKWMSRFSSEPRVV